MTNYREILRLQVLGFNNSRIADSTGATRQTVIAVLQRATAQGVSHQTAEALSDREFSEIAVPAGWGRQNGVRLPELLGELAIARAEGNYRKLMKAYKTVQLLILDEWLLSPLKDSESKELLEIAEARYKKGSMILWSQLDVGGWHEKIGDPTLADAICDRIVHDSYTIVIAGDDSMRKRKGLTTETQRN